MLLVLQWHEPFRSGQRSRLTCVVLALLQDEYIPIVAKFIPGGQLSKSDAERIAPIGNSPTFLSMKQMREVVPIWQNMSVAIYKDKEANGVSQLHVRLRHL